MANDITASAALAFSKSGVEHSVSKSGLQFTVTGTKFTHLVQTVGTTEEALDLGDVGTPGYVWIKNLDATNFVSLRAATGGANCVKLKAGEIALFRLASSAPYVIADTAAVKIEYMLVED